MRLDRHDLFFFGSIGIIDGFHDIGDDFLEIFLHSIAIVIGHGIIFLNHREIITSDVPDGDLSFLSKAFGLLDGSLTVFLSHGWEDKTDEVRFNLWVDADVRGGDGGGERVPERHDQRAADRESFPRIRGPADCEPY